jgi:hypothetical protein
LEQAEEWRVDVAEDASEQSVVASVLQDKLEAASERGVPAATLRRFGGIAFGNGFPVGPALEQYINERRPSNPKQMSVFSACGLQAEFMPICAGQVSCSSTQKPARLHSAISNLQTPPMGIK